MARTIRLQRSSMMTFVPGLIAGEIVTEVDRVAAHRRTTVRRCYRQRRQAVRHLRGVSLSVDLPVPPHPSSEDGADDAATMELVGCHWCRGSFGDHQVAELVIPGRCPSETNVPSAWPGTAAERWPSSSLMVLKVTAVPAGRFDSARTAIGDALIARRDVAHRRPRCLGARCRLSGYRFADGMRRAATSTRVSPRARCQIRRAQRQGEPVAGRQRLLISARGVERHSVRKRWHA